MLNSLLSKLRSIFKSPQIPAPVPQIRRPEKERERRRGMYKWDNYGISVTVDGNLVYGHAYGVMQITPRGSYHFKACYSAEKSFTVHRDGRKEYTDD